MKKWGKEGRGVGVGVFHPFFLPLKHTPLPSQYEPTEGNSMQMTFEGRSGPAPKGGSSATGEFMRLPCLNRSSCWGGTIFILWARSLYDCLRPASLRKLSNEPLHSRKSLSNLRSE